MEQINLGEITVDVELKDIKHLHLSVYPPAGRVRIAAPQRIDLDTIRIYAITKLGWIKSQQLKFANQLRESPRQYINKEGHYYLGKRYLLKLIEHDGKPTVKLKHSAIELYVRPETSVAKRQEVLEEWYRGQLKLLVPQLIGKWATIMQVAPEEHAIKKMKTKWGTCNTTAKRIWLNLELAKKPYHCIEYIVVHEMVHLFERSHNERFIALMDKFLPEWKHCREELNRLPVSHVDWKY